MAVIKSKSTTQYTNCHQGQGLLQLPIVSIINPIEKGNKQRPLRVQEMVAPGNANIFVVDSTTVVRVLEYSSTSGSNLTSFNLKNDGRHVQSYVCKEILKISLITWLGQIFFVNWPFIMKGKDLDHESFIHFHGQLIEIVPLTLTRWSCSNNCCRILN